MSKVMRLKGHLLVLCPQLQNDKNVLHQGVPIALLSAILELDVLHIVLASFNEKMRFWLFFNSFKFSTAAKSAGGSVGNYVTIYQE